MHGLSTIKHLNRDRNRDGVRVDVSNVGKRAYQKPLATASAKK